ncbi:Zinc finger BED domain-containing protein 4 [Eumeta japonica]|uniref:Zinc finger BED domain-containing protein 4 n=1 Tax=Eumeta variegata TaxID=151549 RepID=A0A4C1STS3_EUMVA|nr:Zinc finger BED domain-containing protein 4 [Eumeta japonica]
MFISGNAFLGSFVVYKRVGWYVENEFMRKRRHGVARDVAEWALRFKKRLFKKSAQHVGRILSPAVWKTLVKKVIPEMYQRVRAKVLELLKDLPHIVITTDIWTSDSSQSNDFISLTAHGITATFEYKSYCLEVLPFDGSHTATGNQSQAFKDDKVKEMITKARSIIGHFSHSTSSNKVLKEMQDTHNIANHVLIQDISTRWDSTLQALRRLLEQRVAVQACLPRITCKAELTTEEWIMMEKVVNILRYFEEATKSINKSTATLSDAIPLINSLRKLLENMRGSSPREEENISQKLAGDLLMALNERFEDLENEEIYCLATTLDPRYKTRIFQLYSTTSTAKSVLWS